ncbi:MAG TPA: hypothetical protein VKW04_07055 [Planctomycetota bacterium]|nr:hypothetical protein [Planctomycetota bacterium]
MKQGREQGLALILVMTVVMALAIIATPFVVSMILQERTGTTARYLSQADYGADGAKNYAIWRLMPSLDPLERRSPQGLSSSYTYDTDREFEVHLDEDPLRSKLKIEDPKGSIWGITVQDEQGKLNTKTCNVNALLNLSRMVDGRVVNLKDYLTLYSGRDAIWVCPQRLRQQGFNKGTPGGGITVDNLQFLGPQSRVRVSKSGMKPLETKITGNSLLGGGGQDGFSTEQAVSAYVDGVIEVEQRHPVNLNTAKKETLIAMWEGLHLFQVPGSQVDRPAAQQLATRFYNREMQRLEQFLIQLASTSLSPPQKLAVALNAVCPNAAILDGTGTVGLCFKSYDVYTLEAFSSMNNPAGSEVAGRGYREVVSVSPPITLRRYCESQYDFNQMYSQLQIALQNINPKLAFTGYPYGNRVLTYPLPYTQICDISLKPQQGGPGSPNEAYVTMLPAEDNRGELLDTRYEQQLTGWTDPHNRNHYATEMDGKKESGPETFDWSQFFAFNNVPEDDLEPGQQRPDTGSGGFEIWAKWKADPGSATIFDIREQDTTNRVTLHVDNGELILTAADATIPYPADPDGRIANGVAEIRYPNFKISPDTWTHFAAYWKSNRYADLAMLCDGFSDPQAKFMHYTGPGGSELMTKLSSAMTPTSTTMTLKNSGILPSQSELTPLLVGQEIILYNTGGGGVIRGARGSLAAAHPSQANVQLFGYSSKIRNGQVVANYPGINYNVTMQYDRLPQTSATSTYKFGMNPAAIVCGDKQDPITMIWEMNTMAAQVGIAEVAPSTYTDYPDQGYIRIDDEIIYYAARSSGGVAGTMPPSTAKFTGLVRGQFGSVVANHRSGAQVHMWSVAATNLTGFPSPTIIQIGDEWFGPIQKDPSGKNFWVGFMLGTTPVNFRRGNACFASIQQNHSSGDNVLPTFLGQDVNNWPALGGHSMGPFDRVTLTDGANMKATAQIGRTSPDPPPPGQPMTWPGFFSIQNATQVAALRKPQNRDWVADDLNVRILKFPSGELLSRAWLTTADPKVTIGPVTGQIDELKAFAGTKGRLRLIGPAGVGDTTLQVSQTAIPFWQNGGLFKIGDEYVGYGNWTENGTQGTAAQAKRGWLNSTAELHDQGDSIFYVPWVPVAALGGDVSVQDKTIHLKQRLGGDPARYTSGYILLDNEMVLFQWNGGDGLTLSMPPQWDGQTGLYRGMFGTPTASHSSSTCLAYGMPFRMWDTYKARQFDNSMVYFQWSTNLDLAHWNTYMWNQMLPQGEKNIVVHGMARIDGKGEWWDPPALNDLTLLVDSVTGNGNVKVNRTGYLNDAGQFDVRFYVEYKPGSFDSQNPRTAESWKRTPKIQQIQVEYDRPIQTLHHEDQ